LKILGVALVAISIGVLAWFNVTHNPEVGRSLQPLAQVNTLRQQSTELSVLTYNIKDLALVSAHRKQRMRAIGEFLAAIDLDVVALQEAFIEADRQILIDALGDSPIARFHKYFSSGLAGSGLMVLSRFPIQQHGFQRYSNNGKWYKIHHGDWWAGKGVAVVRLEIADGEFLDVYNTHLQAEYRRQEPFEYVGVRLDQVSELAQFITENRGVGVPQMLLGDLNFRAGSTEWEFTNRLLQLSNLTHRENTVDHILGVVGVGSRWLSVDKHVLHPTVLVDEEEVALSDHPAFHSRVAIAFWQAQR